MTEQQHGAHGWTTIRDQKRLMLQTIVAGLTADEKQAFQKALELNIQGRHQSAPRVRKPLYDHVSGVVG